MSPPEEVAARTGTLRLALGALGVGLLLVALLEGGLRLAGLGAPDPSAPSRLKYQQVFPPMMAPARLADGTEVLRTTDPRVPPQDVLRAKDPDGLRVFAFGGSATAGLGFSPNVTFSRNLEHMLRAACPQERVEVVNLGIVALSSKQVKQLVADACASYEPDLVVVYSGNNEFLEIHAEKFAAARAGLAGDVRRWLRGMHLFRLLQGLVRRPSGPTRLEASSLSHEDLRLTQDSIIQQVEMSPDEIERVIERYEENLAQMVRSAREHGVPILLCAVGSNWEWRGRSDLPEDWLAELVGEGAAGEPDAWQRAREACDERLADAPADERHEWLFRRALVHERLGRLDAARTDYRAAMNADPHLRRALDAMNDRVRAVAEGEGVAFLDTVARLSAAAEHGIVGFDEYYDYVHFTPRGAVLVAAEVLREAERMGLLPAGCEPDPDALADDELGRLEGLEQDRLDVERWLGFGFDRERIHDRDLWKYDAMLVELDERIEADPTDVHARVYRGNARSFRAGGETGAAEDYRAALQQGELPEVRRNLERVERRLTPP